MAKYNVQERQFGKTIGAEIIEAKTRKQAIKKFKKRFFFEKGYVISAQKIHKRKRKR